MKIKVSMLSYPLNVKSFNFYICKKLIFELCFPDFMNILYSEKNNRLFTISRKIQVIKMLIFNLKLF